MTPLCKLAFKYKTDKCPQIRHAYTPFYYKLLKDKRKTVKKVLEIGIGFDKTMQSIKDYVTGASLYMWRDFFPNATVYGVDIYRGCLFEAPRIKTFAYDQGKRHHLLQLIRQTGTDIDVFIDDGSHRSSHQILTAQTLMPLFKKDIVYVIEDVFLPRTIVKALRGYDCETIKFIDKDGRKTILIVVKHKC